MNEIKVRLSMVVPGATMLSSLDCEKMSKKDAYEHSTLTVESKVKKGKKFKTEKEVLHINTRKSIPAKHNILINKDAYQHMISKTEVPASSFTKVWSSMSTKKRLEYHLGLIAEYFKAYSYSYEILDD